MGKWVGINNAKALGLLPLLKAELETKVPSRFSNAWLVPPICLLCCSIFRSHMGEQALKHWESSFFSQCPPRLAGSRGSWETCFVETLSQRFASEKFSEYR